MRRMRSPVVYSGMPYIACSCSFHPAPIPKSRRPFEMISTVVAMLARIAGWRYVLPVTINPRRRRSVRAAKAPSSVQPSSCGPVGSGPRGMKWSKAQACSISGMLSASSQTRRISSYVVNWGAVLIPKRSCFFVDICSISLFSCGNYMLSNGTKPSTLSALPIVCTVALTSQARKAFTRSSVSLSIGDVCS